MARPGDIQRTLRLDDASLRRARHLVYLDEARSHELHAETVPLPAGFRFVTTEFPVGSRDPLEALQLEETLGGASELRARIVDLEARLAATGVYWRTEPGEAAPVHWQKVVLEAPPKLDLRAHEMAIPGEETTRMRFHHFHGKSQDRLYVSLPRKDADGRHVLADLSFQFPHVDRADVRIVHPRLTGTMLSSAVAREHIELPRRGFRKLVEPAQYEEAYGRGWQEAAKQTFRKATSILLGHRAGGPTIKELPRERAPVPDRLQEIMTCADMREALRAYLLPEEEAELIRAGEFAIRRWTQQKRRRADHRQQWQLSLVEASLLIRWAEGSGRKAVIEEEGAKLLRAAKA